MTGRMKRPIRRTDIFYRGIWRTKSRFALVGFIYGVSIPFQHRLTQDWSFTL